MPRYDLQTRYIFIIELKQIYRTSKSGLGVRTTRDFIKGEIVAEYPGDLITTWKVYKERVASYDMCPLPSSFIFEFKWRGKSYWYEIKRNLFVTMKADFFIFNAAI